MSMLAEKIKIANKYSESNVMYSFSSGEEYVLFIRPKIKNGKIIKLILQSHSPDSIEISTFVPTYENINEFVAKMDELLNIDETKNENKRVVCTGVFSSFIKNFTGLPLPNE